MSEERFLSVLKEAKDLFLEKLQAETELRTENGKLLDDIKQLKKENETLLAENKRLSEKLKNSKNFLKAYFMDQLSRMKEIEKDGIYNAKTFSYLLGDVGRSLCNTSFDTTVNETTSKLPTNKKPCSAKLSTNKQNRRSRYEEVKPTRNLNKFAPLLENNSKTSTKNDTSRFQKENEPLLEKDKETLNISTPSSQTERDVKNQENIPNNGKCLDRDLTLSSFIGPPTKTSTQIDSTPSEKNKKLAVSTKNMPIQQNLNNRAPSKNSSLIIDNRNLLDPDITLHSPIGPPSKSSTPQCPNSAEEPKRFSLAFSPPQTSPPLLSEGDFEGLRYTLLPQLVLMEGEVPEQSEPQSPTIPSRSHSLTRTTISVASSPEHKQPKRKRSDLSFASLFPEDKESKSKVLITETPVLERARTKLACPNEVSELSAENEVASPEVIVLDKSDFVKPNSTSIPRKKPKTSLVGNESGANSSSLLLFSFSSQKSASDAPSSKGNKSSNESHETDENKGVEQEKPKINLNFNLDESTDDVRNSDREKEKSPPYKYKEVVRGKDNREKLNGYFCADCEKYYGGLKLSDEEMKERLKACSRHRARFSPPPSTPDHFWQVDFMNTDEYIEQGFMRTESELPPEKRKLKSRRFKGKLQK